ncbi:MAG: histidine phosphatase family protein [Firmicutes bacterium]|jgi:broad specificity phosphatase PhoE|nr:histidine phosphatase family protein [Bacillota bacterium]
MISIYHNLPIFKVDELKEFNFGVWEGMGYEEIKKISFGSKKVGRGLEKP